MANFFANESRSKLMAYYVCYMLPSYFACMREPLNINVRKDGDGDIPTQEVGTALRALGTYPSVSRGQTIKKNIQQFSIFHTGERIKYENERY